MTTKSESTEKRPTVESDATPAAAKSVRKSSPKAPKAGQRPKTAKAGAKTGKGARRSAANTKKLRGGTKGAKILELIRHASGATLAEIGKATGWQSHSIRGFLSTVTKKHHLKIDSSKNGTGERVYRAAK